MPFGSAAAAKKRAHNQEDHRNGKRDKKQSSHGVKGKGPSLRLVRPIKRDGGLSGAAYLPLGNRAKLFTSPMRHLALEPETGTPYPVETGAKK